MGQLLRQVSSSSPMTLQVLRGIQSTKRLLLGNDSAKRALEWTSPRLRLADHAHEWRHGEVSLSLPLTSQGLREEAAGAKAENE